MRALTPSLLSEAVVARNRQQTRALQRSDSPHSYNLFATWVLLMDRPTCELCSSVEEASKAQSASYWATNPWVNSQCFPTSPMYPMEASDTCG